ncbi:MAG: GGDEF domain-containing protein [Arenimonas sp.]|nr:GGDEF domain-containing protein [Arenimonas sp.]
MDLPGLRRDSFTLLREEMRWRVAVVLSSLISVLMVVLGSINTHLGIADNAVLAWIVLVIALACLLGLVKLPKHQGGTLFFVTIALLLVGVMAYGSYFGRSMQHWAYIFPPVLVFLLRAGPALAAMVAYGVYASLMVAPLVEPIAVVRFASAYGLLVCFMYTYALLQEQAAVMLRYHSDHDALSNCLNRRTFNEAMEQLAGSRSSAQSCTFLLIDIDHFKAINDRHGHLVGDRIITQVAAELGRVLDPGTPLFRYGGEEFAVMLADAGPDAGAHLAERLRDAVARGDFQGVDVTVSIGVAHWHRSGDTVSVAVDQADQALYVAKGAGRNCISLFPAAPSAAS